MATPAKPTTTTDVLDIFRTEIAALGSRIDALGNRIDSIRRLIWTLLALIALLYPAVFGLVYMVVTGS